jgi:hypothetical protein
VNINLHLTDTTDLRAEGYVLDGRLLPRSAGASPTPPASLATVRCGAPPKTMRRPPKLAVQAAIQAEEEAAWQARAATTAAAAGSRVA